MSPKSNAIRFKRASRLVACAVLAASASGLVAKETALSPWQAVQQQYLAASRHEHNAQYAWQEVAAWNFDKGGIPPEFKIIEGEWKVEKGCLWASGGGKDQNRTIKFAECRWPVFRLEFDAALHANPGADPVRISDIGIRFNCDPATASLDSGYSVITAAYGNQVTTLYRLNIPSARTEWSPIVPGKRHHVALEVAKPHIRFWVDGRVVLDFWERRGRDGADSSDFLDMDPHQVMALQTYDTRMEIDNLQISVPKEK